MSALGIRANSSNDAMDVDGDINRKKRKGGDPLVESDNKRRKSKEEPILPLEVLQCISSWLDVRDFNALRSTCWSHIDLSVKYYLEETPWRVSQVLHYSKGSFNPPALPPHWSLALESTMTALKQLNLSYGNLNVPAEVFPKALPSLQQLQLSNMTLTNGILESIGQMTHLQELKMKKSKAPINIGASVSFNRLTALKTLHLHESSFVYHPPATGTNDLPPLQTLSLDVNDAWDKNSQFILNPSLEQLTLSTSYNCTTLLQEMGEKLTRLRDLHLKGCFYLPTEVQACGSLSTLKTLKINYCDFTKENGEALLTLLNNKPNLERVDLVLKMCSTSNWNPFFENEEEWQTFLDAWNKHAQKLSIAIVLKVNEEEEDLEVIEPNQFGSLFAAFHQMIHSLTIQSEDLFTPQNLATLKQQPLLHVKTLSIGYINISDEAFLEFISACPNVESLKILDVMNISNDAIITALKRLTKLQHLQIKGVIPGKLVRQIGAKACRKLLTLSLSSCSRLKMSDLLIILENNPLEALFLELNPSCQNMMDLLTSSAAQSLKYLEILKKEKALVAALPSLKKMPLIAVLGGDNLIWTRELGQVSLEQRKSLRKKYFK